MSAVLRVGLVGLGSMGRNHARAIQEVEGLTLAGIADAQPSAAVPGGIRLVRDVDELVALGIDLAVVAVPTAAHEEIAVRLAEAGVHTMVEKPLAPDPLAARRIRNAFAHAGLVGCVGHIERFNPALLAMRARLANGELGEVYQIVTRRQGPFPARIADVGVVKDLATHDVDLTEWCAQSSFRTVTAHVAHRSGRRHEDLVVAVGRLESGVVTSHLVNWLSPFKERVTVATGERGALVAETLSGDLTWHQNGTQVNEWQSVTTFRGVTEGDMTRLAIPKREPLVVELEAFRDAVRGVRDDVVSMTDGLRAAVIAEALLQSAETGRSVDLPARAHAHQG